jgi:hypothetical protein
MWTFDSGWTWSEATGTTMARNESIGKTLQVNHLEYHCAQQAKCESSTPRQIHVYSAISIWRVRAAVRVTVSALHSDRHYANEMPFSRHVADAINTGVMERLRELLLNGFGGVATTDKDIKLAV